MCCHIPSGRRSKRIGRIRYQRDLGGTHREGKVDKSLVGIAFHIELSVEQRTELVHIVALDMALVGARMHRYTVGTVAFDIESHCTDIGTVLAACISQCGYFVYINA